MSSKRFRLLGIDCNGYIDMYSENATVPLNLKPEILPRNEFAWARLTDKCNSWIG